MRRVGRPGARRATSADDDALRGPKREPPNRGSGGALDPGECAALERHLRHVLGHDAQRAGRAATRDRERGDGSQVQVPVTVDDVGVGDVRPEDLDDSG